jgi:hypothetical protein
LMLSAHGYEIPDYAVGNDFYRQALEIDLRNKREFTEPILAAMGGIGRMHFSRYKALLHLSDEALELADRHNLEEGILRHVLLLPATAHAEMVQQIVQFNLTGKQVKEICEQEGSDTEPDQGSTKPAAADIRLIKIMRNIERQAPQTLVHALVNEEKSVHLARARLHSMMDFLKQASQMLPTEES